MREARRLRERKARQAAGLFLVEGPHLIAEAREAGVVLRDVFTTREAAGAYLVSERAMRALAETETPQGLVAVAEIPQPGRPPGAGLHLLLDGVADPGNLGAVLRAGLAFGAVRCLLGPGCVDPWNGKALRAAAGATFRLVPEEVADLAASCQQLTGEGYAVYGLAARGGIPLTEADLPLRTVLVLGSEAHGLSPSVESTVQLLTIPMSGAVESLNAATAVAIAAFTWSARQQ